MSWQVGLRTDFLGVGEPSLPRISLWCVVASPAAGGSSQLTNTAPSEPRPRPADWGLWPCLYTDGPQGWASLPLTWVDHTFLPTFM